MTVGALGAVHEMLSSDRQKAAETIIERNAGQSEEDDAQSDPPRRLKRPSDNGWGTPPAE